MSKHINTVLTIQSTDGKTIRKNGKKLQQKYGMLFFLKVNIIELAIRVTGTKLPTMLPTPEVVTG